MSLMWGWHVREAPQGCHPGLSSEHACSHEGAVSVSTTDRTTSARLRKDVEVFPRCPGCVFVDFPNEIGVNPSKPASSPRDCEHQHGFWRAESFLATTERGSHLRMGFITRKSDSDYSPFSRREPSTNVRLLARFEKGWDPQRLHF